MGAGSGPIDTLVSLGLTRDSVSHPSELSRFKARGTMSAVLAHGGVRTRVRMCLIWTKLIDPGELFGLFSVMK